MTRLVGFEEMNRKLRQLPGKVANKVIRKGTSKMAQVVRKEIKSRAPSRSGDLKKEIRFKITRGKNGGYSAEVGAFNKGFYALFIEFGTNPHRIKPKGKKKVLNFGGSQVSEVIHPGTNAKPFIQPGFKAAQNEAVRQAGIVVMKEINKLI
jgi:HK97 gp10 family phage protein